MSAEKSNERDQEKPQYKTDGGKTKSNAIEVPSISLPKGGGAIKGIDQKFTVNAVNGTASFSIPLPVSPARGATPSLNLSYNSGGGNGIFGLGWRLNLPSIKRKTDKELPQYNDFIDSDTYLLSEAEDLVPEFEKDGSGNFIPQGDGYQIKESTTGTWTTRFYKPRIEGLFARIERWTDSSSGEIKWRVISKENIITLYGWNNDGRSRICDPANLSRIFEWLPEMVIDDKGNCAVYKYKAEDQVGIDATKLFNTNRFNGSAISYTNRYIDKILYGNKTPYTYSFASTAPSDSDFMFQTVFDYGQYSAGAPHSSGGNWNFREDPFSEYKAGFEIRTTRCCERVLLFHYFSGAFPDDYAVVKSLEFKYDNNGSTGFTFLKSITSHGHIKLSSTTESVKSLPAVEFTYQDLIWGKEAKAISPENVLHAPVGLNSPYQFTDLYNEGLSGILSEQGNSWYYKHNLGGGIFSAARPVSPKPSFNGLNGNLQILDLDGDGVKQLVNFKGSPQGYFEINDDEEWQRYKTFKNLPNIDLNDKNARLLDLNGDGKTDLLITEESVFMWYESDGRNGYKDFHKTLKPFDEEDGPQMVFSDTTQGIYLADMSGDGLVDIVRIRNGEVCYWPNLGYGNFGKKVPMDNAPLFDGKGDFDPRYIKIADIDGSGTPDLIYLGKNKFSCWLNLSGNSYSTTPFEIDEFPSIHKNADITVTDLLGNGLSCIVWSSTLQKDAGTPLRYVDLMNSSKPHIMTGYKNNMGNEVALEYTPSTKYYIDDKLAGNPWVTKLHFPVYCLSKVTTKDKVTGHIFSSTYSYHHGYFDHAEKEFRGFGRVEQKDTENFEHWNTANGTNLTDASVNQAPVVTRSWFHTGAYVRDSKILDQFATEYWDKAFFRKYNKAVDTKETILPEARILRNNVDYKNQLNYTELREAYRSCKSLSLRTEVFAEEGSSTEQDTPYMVSTHNCMIEVLQPAGQNKHAVFFVKESESVIYSYERKLIPVMSGANIVSYNSDPRVSHKINLVVDLYGNILKSASIAYPRFLPNTNLQTETQNAQAKTAIIYAVNSFTNDVDVPDKYRLRLPWQTKTFEITNLPKDTANVYSANDKYTIVDFADFDPEDITVAIPYEQLVSSGTKARLIEHVKTLYYYDDLVYEVSSNPSIYEDHVLAEGFLESKAIVYENYQLAYTENSFSDLLDDVFNEPAQAGPPAIPAITRVTGVDMLAGQFEQIGNDWWIRSGVVRYRKTNETNDTLTKIRFYTPVSYTNQYGSTTLVDYDTNYYLYITKVTSVITSTQSNETSVQTFNYRTLSPVETKDANDNISLVLLDELGLPKAVAAKGKTTQSFNDLSGLSAETLGAEQNDIDDYFDAASADLTNYFIYQGNTPDATNLETMAKNLLQHASARFVYDFHRYKNSGGLDPVVVSSIVREEHYSVNANSPVQISFEYSNGSGQVVMKKMQAEGGEALQVLSTGLTTVSITNYDTTLTSSSQTHTAPPNNPTLRWIGNGKTVLNNKGNPVKQYEPYFSVSAKYESFKELVEQGVTPLLHYDAIGRLIRTDFPDDTFSKVEFDNWKQIAYDQNDTCKDSIWYDDRDSTPNSAKLLAAGKIVVYEQDAATKADAHYNTPKIVHFDSLGRAVTEEETDGSTTLFTHLFLDIEGNLRTVRDARHPLTNVECMQYKYDMLGNMVYQHSMDSGKRWLLHDSMGAPLRTWDQRNHEIEFEYDGMHRPLTVKVIGGDGNTSLNHLVEKYIYGEGQSNDKLLNLRGNLFQHYDTGGLEEMATYDFANRALSNERWLAEDYKSVAHWGAPVNPQPATSILETISFTISTLFDALGRIKEQTAPDGSIITPTYSPRAVLYSETVDQSVAPNPPNPILHLAAIEYDAKGQRSYVEYGNGVYTKYTYDANTFRLQNLLTKKGGNTLQSLIYTYDAVGNITRVEDASIATVFYSNTSIDPINDYTYDALYRLTKAKGRELRSIATFGTEDNWGDAPFKTNFGGNGSVALQNYTQEYTYDVVGNITQLKHVGEQVGSYTRTYQINSGNNRVDWTKIGSEPLPYNYNYHPEHGFLTSLPHLPLMEWNFKEEMTASSKQSVGGSTIPEITYYQYDSRGKRLRKVTENDSNNNPPLKKNQRIYIDGYEFYEDFASGNTTETLSLIDNGQRFVMIEVSTDPNITSPLTRYVHPNHQASCTLETDDMGNVIAYEEYHPFGTTAYLAKDPNIKASAKRYRYTGMERDEETGLNYHNARYYIPWLGRWLNCDPIGINDGVNVYSYCKNNPIMLNDRNGLSGDPPDFDGLKKKIDELYNKSKDEKLSSEDRKAAKTQMVAEMDNLINLVDSVKDKNVNVEFGADLFYSFLIEKQLIADTKENKDNYDRGCVGISMVLTGKSEKELRDNAKYKNYYAASKQGYSKVYAIHFHDAEKYYSDPEVKDYLTIEIEKLKSNPDFLKEANRKAALMLDNNKNNDPTSFSQDELTAYFVGKVWEQMKAGDDYKENSDGTIDISGWDFKNPLGVVFDFGFYYKPNTIFHANEGNAGGTMQVYISNKREFEKKGLNDKGEWYKGALPYICPCIGALDFNQQAYGGF